MGGQWAADSVSACVKAKQVLQRHQTDNGGESTRNSNARVVRKCERLESKLWRYLAERKKKNNIYLYRYIVKYIYIYLHIVIFRL